MTRYIFVTGGVVSSLGKGIAAASIACLMEHRGHKVAMMKMDPYINIDAGTMSPYQHGEVFVTHDGFETDLDLGHYERFTNSFALTKTNSVTTGQVYQRVIERERRGEFLGRTVQVIPHITNEIISRVHATAHNNHADIVIVEIGGTVGDIESIPFLEAMRQFSIETGRDNVMFIHVTLVPTITNGEMKSKPTQHSVHELQKLGIQPDILLLRNQEPIPKEMREKLSLFCNIPKEGVFSAVDCKSIYEVPLAYRKEEIDTYICKRFGYDLNAPDLAEWTEMVRRIRNPKHKVRIGIVGKYVDLPDAYQSLNEAVIHGAAANHARVKIKFLDSEIVNEDNVADELEKFDGIIIPGGFGERGIEGKITALKYARENRIPTFGICLGLQCMVIEFARHAANLEHANSTEFDGNSPHPVVSLLEEQKAVPVFGASMRLGAFVTNFTRGSLAARAYENDSARERHRHRYEVNNAYIEPLERQGLQVTGTCEGRDLVEVVEVPDHPWYLGVQFHPEFTSKPLAPNPLFRSFMAATVERNVIRRREKIHEAQQEAAANVIPGDDTVDLDDAESSVDEAETSRETPIQTSI